MTFKNIFDGLDSKFKQWFQITAEREEKHYTTWSKADAIKDILYNMDIIDSKSSALLTHISIMFLVLGFFITDKGNPWFIHFLLLIEFIAYLVVSMVLLRCIDIMGPPFRQLPEDEEELKKTYYLEVALRREIYHRSIRTVYILTALFIPIVFFNYIL